MAKNKVSIEEIQRGKGVTITPITKVVFVALIAVAIVASLIAIASSIGKANELPESQKIVKSLSGKSLAEDRTDAINAVKDLMISTNAPASIAEAAKSIEKLESGDFSSFDDSFTNYVRYYDLYSENSDFQAEIAMSIYSMASLAKEANGGSIEPDLSQMSTVRVDQETGIAQVPIQIFTGNESPVAFQMIYVNDSWKLEPHSFSSYIRLSALAQSKN